VAVRVILVSDEGRRTSTSKALAEALKRLARIPGEPSSEIRIAMFSMWDERGIRIAERLAELSRAGAGL
jgi:hypothetical protein